VLRRQREEDRKSLQQSIVDSKTELQKIIERWSEQMDTELFFSLLEQRANDLPEADNHVVNYSALWVHGISTSPLCSLDVLQLAGVKLLR